MERKRNEARHAAAERREGARARAAEMRAREATRPRDGSAEVGERAAAEGARDVALARVRAALGEAGSNAAPRERSLIAGADTW